MWPKSLRPRFGDPQDDKDMPDMPGARCAALGGKGYATRSDSISTLLNLKSTVVAVAN